MNLKSFNMRNLFIFISVFVNCYVNAVSLGTLESTLSKGPMENFTFNQILDHFDTENTVLWSQRYSSNSEFFSSMDDSPIFLLVGGEGPYQPINLLATAWNEWASQHGAMMYYLEHRFFGESLPTEDMSKDNIKYLTTQQALADIAHFIESINKENGYTSKNKWILFAGSYPGAIVAWARLQYPNLIFAAVSSSGPIQAEVDFSQYNDVALEQLNLASPGCGDTVREAYASLSQIIESGSDSDIANMTDQFSICPSFDASIMGDRVLFYKAASNEITNVVQYNNNPAKPYTILDTCHKYFSNTTLGSPLDRLIARYQDLTTFKKHGHCNEVSYAYYINLHHDVQFSNRINGKRQWLYLLCNELGYSQTSSTKESLYSATMPLDFYTGQCRDIFGEEFGEEHMRKGVEETNKRNLGWDNNATNIVFVEGTVDPWHPLGMIKNPTEDSPLIVIEGGSHCRDMSGHYRKNPPAIDEALDKISSYIKKWVG